MGHELWTADGEHAERVGGWLRSSPDHTVYHLPPYTRFIADQGASAGLVLVARAGEILFGFPAYVDTPHAFDGGFCGFVLPDVRKERTLRRTCAAIVEFFAANPQLRSFGALQSLQCRGARDADRRTLLDWQLAALGSHFHTRDVFSRVLRLDEAKTPMSRRPASGTWPAEALDEDLLARYEGDLRNQIRQALRNGLSLRFSVATGQRTTEHDVAYHDYAQLHGESWNRTGLHARPLEHWRRLCDAIVGGGGTDLIVQVLDGERAVAGVTCHVYQEQAIYWSGGSLLDGQRKRANPLALHAAIGLCRRLGVRWFEIGRFEPKESAKRQAIDRYKAQFGGEVTRVPNVSLRRLDLTTVAADEAWRLRHQMPTRYPRLWRWVEPWAMHPLTRRLVFRDARPAPAG
jgi:hypothetical protein